jgi:4-hydroxybenzoyl-CoA reductase subunit beta
MLRLPRFQYHAPETIREAAELLARQPGEAMLVAGGTDLLPNMKRRQQVPSVLIGLRRIRELHAVGNGEGVRIGAGVTLANLESLPALWLQYTGLRQAVAQIATPHLRNMGTIGGNLCLDTRCNYYDQTEEWRKAIGFCLKKDGDVCWVATGSPRCLAVSSTDTAPMLIALGARVSLESASGGREVAIADLYRNDGIDYLTRRPDEILTAVHLPALEGWRSAYWKLRRRGAFDFPVLSVAAAAQFAADGSVTAARLVLGAVASRPLDAADAAAALVGRPLTDEAIAEAATQAARTAKPMDNTDLSLLWRKRVARDFVTYALKELRGDDVRELRRKILRLEA